MVIVKNRGFAYPWTVYHSSLTATKGIFLEQTNPPVTSNLYWNNTNPSSSVFTVGSAARTNRSGYDLVAYCFAPVAGYSSFGSYTGNGSADGPFVYTGFRPRWIMAKCSSSDQAGNAFWIIYDAVRSSYNVMVNELTANTSSAEGAGLTTFDALSNGFKCRNTNSRSNASSATYIYACFSEHPFAYARAR
jgi:hypothetical protein